MSTTVVTLATETTEQKVLFKLLKRKYKLESRGDRGSDELKAIYEKLKKYDITPQ